MCKRLYCLFVCILAHAHVAIGSPSSDQSESESASQKNQAKVVPAPKLSKQELAEIQKRIYEYEQAIGEIESDSGAYGLGMGQQLDALGVAYQQLGKHTEAIDIFKRAIHLTRIHEGLYTHSQLPMVQRQINSLMMLNQWDEVSNRYQYMYWLNTVTFGEDDPRMLPSLYQLSKWHLQAYAMNFGSSREEIANHLIKAHDMIEKSIMLLEKQGNEEQRLVNNLNALALTNYLFATLQRTPTSKLAASSRSQLEGGKTHFVSQMIDIYINRSFRAGRDAISRIVDIYSNSNTAPPYAVAKSKVRLGDWLFLFDKKDAAMEIYADAYQMLKTETQGKQEIDRIFSQPVALPNQDLLETNNFYSMDQAQYDANNHYVVASFDVTEQGKTANIEIIESVPENNYSARSQVKRSLKIAKFRPRFVEGEPALTEKIQLRILSH